MFGFVDPAAALFLALYHFSTVHTGQSSHSANITATVPPQLADGANSFKFCSDPGPAVFPTRPEAVEV